MNRRGARRTTDRTLNEKFRVAFRLVVVAIGLTVLTTATSATFVSANEFSTDAPASTDTTTDTEPEPVPDTARPPTTANDFFPEDRDLTSCIGVLERPGCGSESRGGWRQTLVVVAIFAGLAVVFTNVVRGIRRNRSD